MEFSEESEIELESFIPRSSDQKDEGPPYDAKSKSRRHPGLYLQRAHFWICHNTRSKMLCFGILLIVGNFAKNSAAIYGTRKIAAGASIKSDYSNIGNLDDLRAISSSIDDFCFPGMEKNCDCPNPMEPKDRQGRRHWLKTSHENKDKAAETEDLDVVFYGDSITEGWMGTSFGFPNGRKEKNEEVFKSLFTLDGGGKHNGVTLGISGDLTTSLLWRLQNGEMPANLHPKVFWLLIGTNDVGNKWCSPEATLLGILRVVEEIRKQKPGTMIILNSILPRSWHRNGNVLKGKGIKKGQYLPELWTAIQDINNHLSAYSDLHENIIYFDANDVFFTGTSTGEPSDEKSKQLRIDHNLMPDFLHPSAVGYKLWGDRIVAKLDELIKV